MRDDVSTRRDFLAASGAAMGGAWLASLAPWLESTRAFAREALQGGRAFDTFTASEARDFEAFAARIVPSDETPGAREAGAVYFADRALGSFMADILPIVRGGLAAMGQRVAQTFDGESGFADLNEDQQDRIISAVEREDPTFFFFARTLVMLGLVSDPQYGGNRDKVGWQLLGFEDRFAYQPPFGFYDREEHGTGGGEGAP